MGEIEPDGPEHGLKTKDPDEGIEAIAERELASFIAEIRDPTKRARLLGLARQAALLKIKERTLTGDESEREALIVEYATVQASIRLTLAAAQIRAETMVRTVADAIVDRVVTAALRA